MSISHTPTQQIASHPHSIFPKHLHSIIFESFQDNTCHFQDFFLKNNCFWTYAYMFQKRQKRCQKLKIKKHSKIVSSIFFYCIKNESKSSIRVQRNKVYINVNNISMHEIKHYLMYVCYSPSFF